VGHLLRQRFEKAEESVVVDYYLVRWVGSTRASESRAIRWEDGETALQLLTFDDSKEVMERAIALTEE
jgi:hypothetical protein